MLISNMEEMENIVKSSKNLTWSGWDVIYLRQDDYAEFHLDGYFDNQSSKWYRKSVYSCGENGWDIPDSVIS